MTIDPKKARTEAGRRALVQGLLEVCATGTVDDATVGACLAVLRTPEPKKAVQSWRVAIDAALVAIARGYGAWAQGAKTVTVPADDVTARLATMFEGDEDAGLRWVRTRIVAYVPAIAPPPLAAVAKMLDWFEGRTRAQIQGGSLRELVFFLLAMGGDRPDVRRELGRRVEKRPLNAYHAWAYRAGAEAMGAEGIELYPLAQVIETLRAGNVSTFTAVCRRGLESFGAT